MSNRCEPQVWLTLLSAGVVLLAVRPEVSGSYQWGLGAGALFGAAAVFAFVKVPGSRQRTKASISGEDSGAVPGARRELKMIDSIIALSRPPGEALSPLGNAPPDIGSLEEIRARGSAGVYRYTPTPIRLDAGDHEDDLRLAA